VRVPDHNKCDSPIIFPPIILPPTCGGPDWNGVASTDVPQENDVLKKVNNNTLPQPKKRVRRRAATNAAGKVCNEKIKKQGEKEGDAAETKRMRTKRKMKEREDKGTASPQGIDACGENRSSPTWHGNPIVQFQFEMEPPAGVHDNNKVRGPPHDDSSSSDVRYDGEPTSSLSSASSSLSAPAECGLENVVNNNNKGERKKRARKNTAAGSTSGDEKKRFRVKEEIDNNSPSGNDCAGIKARERNQQSSDQPIEVKVESPQSLTARITLPRHTQAVKLEESPNDHSTTSTRSAPHSTNTPVKEEEEKTESNSPTYGGLQSPKYASAETGKVGGKRKPRVRASTTKVEPMEENGDGATKKIVRIISQVQSGVRGVIWRSGESYLRARKLKIDPVEARYYDCWNATWQVNERLKLQRFFVRDYVGNDVTYEEAGKLAFQAAIEKRMEMMKQLALEAAKNGKRPRNSIIQSGVVGVTWERSRAAWQVRLCIGNARIKQPNGKRGHVKVFKRLLYTKNFMLPSDQYHLDLGPMERSREAAVKLRREWEAKYFQYVSVP